MPSVLMLSRCSAMLKTPSRANDHLAVQLVREPRTRRPVTLLVEIQLVDHLAGTRPENGTARIEVET